MVPLTLRYNNPGALEYQPWMASYGARLGDNGRYAAFDSPDAGYAVMGRVLDTYQNKHGLNTVSGIINRWAPANVDNNSTSLYTQKVAQALGVDPNAPLSAEHRPALMQAMASYEAGRPAPMPQGAPTGPAPGSFRAAQAVPETPAPQATGAAPMQFPQMIPQFNPQMMPQEGGFMSGLQNMASNPLFLMGASVLGSQNVGQGLYSGAQAANQMQQQAYERQRQTEADARTREMFPLQKQMLQTQIQNAATPTTEDIKEFEYAKKGGYSGGFQDWMALRTAQKQGGLYGQNGQIFQDKTGNFFSVQFGRDGTLKTQPVTSPGGGGEALTPSKGVEVVGDIAINKATGQTVRGVGEALSGKEVAKETGEAKGKFIASIPKHEARIAGLDSQTGLINQEIGRAVSLIDGGGVTAWAGGAARYLPGTAAFELAERLKTVRANIGFDRLQQMRDESPTGGALGQVAVQELEALQAVMGSLDQKQDAASLKGNLLRLTQLLEQRGARLKQAFEAEKSRYGTTAPGLNAPGGAAPQAAPTGGQKFRYNPQTGALEPM